MNRMPVAPMGLALFACLLTSLPGSAQETRATHAPPAIGLNDAEFWIIASDGPADSRELETLVTVYTENGMRTQARQAFIDYLVSPDRSRGHCEFCYSLLSEEEPGDLASLFSDAIDLIVERGYEQHSGEEVLSTALVVAGSDSRKNHDYAMYLLVSSVQFGLDDSSLITVVRTLTMLGELDIAKTLATVLHEDATSAYFESPVVAKWLDYFDTELARREKIASTLIATAMK